MGLFSLHMIKVLGSHSSLFSDDSTGRYKYVKSTGYRSKETNDGKGVRNKGSSGSTKLTSFQHFI